VVRLRLACILSVKEDVSRQEHACRGPSVPRRDSQGRAAQTDDPLDSAESRETIRAIPGNEWEKLTADREGQESIRVNDQYRVCFTWTDEGPADVEITDYH